MKIKWYMWVLFPAVFGLMIALFFLGFFEIAVIWALTMILTIQIGTNL